MNRERLIWIAIILAILAIAVFIGRRDGRKLEQLRNQSELLEREAKDKQATIDSSAITIARIQVQREQTIKITLQEQGALKAEISRLKRRRQPDAKNVIVEPDHPPVDSEAILASCDSIVGLQDVLIQSLEVERAKIVASYEQELKLHMQKYIAQAAISDLYRKTAEQKTTQLRRETRKKKFFRGSSVVGAVVLGVLLISGK